MYAERGFSSLLLRGIGKRSRAVKWYTLMNTYSKREFNQLLLHGLRDRVVREISFAALNF